ncbi:hypothetical protein RFI_25124 [Reticulomyxa filosa]|uniref:Uncharacterized protein n=1 Tax=Reticulomyxa filosa TaxID=46433 RepID=X6MFQ2_RETFI|nr:hypothetical protein RFI_25124 [Reticulomyxa filosa]|eukprot:ETO12252.1 hypothetical protein RFI_25124 [Reticulomyxa filosa]
MTTRRTAGSSSAKQKALHDSSTNSTGGSKASSHDKNAEWLKAIESEKFTEQDDQPLTLHNVNVLRVCGFLELIDDLDQKYLNFSIPSPEELITWLSAPQPSTEVREIFIELLGKLSPDIAKARKNIMLSEFNDALFGFFSKKSQEDSNPVVMYCNYPTNSEAIAWEGMTWHDLPVGARLSLLQNLIDFCLTEDKDLHKLINANRKALILPSICQTSTYDGNLSMKYI